jgi:tartrate dehydratase alpha subunit/fumarate hydratase class I-like protein
MYEENTANNMPAQCEIYVEGDDAYKFMFMAAGGERQQELVPGDAIGADKDRLLAFLKEKVLTLGTAACPLYHLAIVIGGTSAELCMKTVKLVSARYPMRRPMGQRTATRSAIGDGAGPEDDAVARRRRAVRRQVFLPRRG